MADQPQPQAQASTQSQSRPQNRERRGRRPDMVPEEKQFDERTLHIDRVARVVKGGRRFRFRALVVVGDRKNRVGIGTAKGADVTAAVAKATEVAKKHFVTVPIYKGTLPHEVETKVSGAHILLKPASAGTGLIAGGVVRTILEVAGIKDALSKSLGSSNKTNTAYATIAAFELLAPASKWVTTVARPAAKATKTVASVTAQTDKTDKTIKPAKVEKIEKVETAVKAPAAAARKPATKKKTEDK